MAQTHPAKIEDAIKAATDNLDTIDGYANSLSKTVSSLSGGSNFDDKEGHMQSDLNSIKKTIGKLDSLIKDLYVFLGEPQKSACKQHFENFNFQYEFMNRKMETLINESNDPIYSAQIDYTENGITNFISATGNFREYLKTLIPIITVDLLQKIKDRLDQTDSNIKRRAHKTDKLVIKKAELLADGIGSVGQKADKIISLLTPKLIEGRQFVGLTAYSRALFGLSYLHRVGKATSDSTVNHLGAELLLPFDKVNAKSPGAFILYGLRYDKILIEAGAGYFKNTRTNDNVSWKCGLLFVPAKTIGIGMAYSPLTGAGLQLAYRW
jgi:hypothetical protein